jgi:hypothetical protein
VILFAKGRHHKNISVILLTQNLFHQGRNCRNISLNAKYLVLLKNARDKNQFTYVARQVYAEHSGSLYSAYLGSSQKTHGYLILDFTQDTNDMLRFRTNIFLDEYPPIIYAPVDNETNKFELPHASNIKKRKA